eukprot:3284172-Prymnesium_polylepis.3
MCSRLFSDLAALHPARVASVNTVSLRPGCTADLRSPGIPSLESPEYSAPLCNCVHALWRVRPCGSGCGLCLWAVAHLFHRSRMAKMRP